MSMSDYALEVEEQSYEDQGWMQIEREHQEHLEAIYYIEMFQTIVKEEENYADLIVAENKIVEYQEVYVNYENNSTDELRTKIESLGQIIVDLADKLKEQANQIPISEMKAKYIHFYIHLNINIHIDPLNRDNEVILNQMGHLL